MDSLPIEKQVCTLDQAKKLADLLGDDAPGSLWVWWFDEVQQEFILMLYDDESECPLSLEFEQFYPAYTGDELSVLLVNIRGKLVYKIPKLPAEKASLLIELLNKTWVLPSWLDYYKQRTG